VKFGIPVQGILHDVSKFTLTEFLPYTEHFYGSKKVPPEMGPEMKAAWLHHIRCNLHHWDAWLLPNGEGHDALEMPLKYRKEMLADWFGFDRAIGGSGDIREFYRRTMKKRILGPMWEGEYGETQQRLDLESKDKSIAQLKTKEFFFKLPLVAPIEPEYPPFNRWWAVQEGIFDADSKTFRVCGGGANGPMPFS